MCSDMDSTDILKTFATNQTPGSVWFYADNMDICIVVGREFEWSLVLVQ